MARSYYVYILASRSRALYVGVTNDLMSRLAEHRRARPHSFTGRYRIHRLVYFEHTTNILAAITREKQLKGWTRERKLPPIEDSNPFWLDLSADWSLSATDGRHPERSEGSSVDGEGPAPAKCG